jgi:uncharacterized protein with FMN-binding domain
MPFIFAVVAIIVVAMGSALYVRTNTEVVTNSEPGAITELVASSTTELEELSTPPETVPSSTPADEVVTVPIEPPVATLPTPTPVSPTPVEVTPAPIPTPTPVPTAPASTYADGTYTKTGYYSAPSGREALTVSVTLKNDIITSSAVSGKSNNKTSQHYIDKFIAGFGAYAIGKDIDRVSMDVVNGASLTPDGYINALATIKTTAKL